MTKKVKVLIIGNGSPLKGLVASAGLLSERVASAEDGSMELELDGKPVTLCVEQDGKPIFNCGPMLLTPGNLFEFKLDQYKEEADAVHTTKAAPEP